MNRKSKTYNALREVSLWVEEREEGTITEQELLINLNHIFKEVFG